MIKIITILSAVFVLMATPSAYSWEYAWWLTTKFVPSDTHIEDIPLSEINKNWIATTILSQRHIPEKEMEDFKKYDEPYGYKFSREGDFNGDGVPDRAMVGVYKDKNGEEGRFILILTKQKNGNWIKSFLHSQPDGPKFSILAGDKNKLIWAVCMECDGEAEIKWVKGQYKLIWK